jgi:hypothetical protein
MAQSTVSAQQQRKAGHDWGQQKNVHHFAQKTYILSYRRIALFGGDPPVALLLCHMWVLSFNYWGVKLMEGSRG